MQCLRFWLLLRSHRAGGEIFLPTPPSVAPCIISHTIPKGSPITKNRFSGAQESAEGRKSHSMYVNSNLFTEGKLGSK